MGTTEPETDGQALTKPAGVKWVQSPEPICLLTAPTPLTRSAVALYDFHKHGAWLKTTERKSLKF